VSVDTETWIALGSLVVAAAGVVAYLWFESRKKGEKKDVTARAHGGHAVAGSGNVLIGNVTVNHPAAPPATPARAAPALEAPPARPAPREEPVKQRVKRDPHVCDSGPFEVEAGSLQKIELDVEPGDILVGKMEGDADFDYDIVNEKNYVRMRRREDFDAADYGEGEPAYGIGWKVRGKGPWFLVLSAPRRQYARTVHVYLRKE